MKTILIVGGGASGMTAAITAAKILGRNASVTLAERKDRVGKKLLATGNGRCNLTNTQMGQEHYAGADAGFVRLPLRRFGPAETIAFFQELGLVCREEYGGRVFPYCEQASAVLDVLRNALEHYGVSCVLETEVRRIVQNGIDLKAELETQGELSTAGFSRVIIAAGGAASPALGSNGSGFQLLHELGHAIAPVVPVLSQLQTSPCLPSLAGIKMNCRIRAVKHGETLMAREGEVLFTKYGLSGSGILDISLALRISEHFSLLLDMMPEYEPDQLLSFLKCRQAKLGYLTCEQFLTGTIHKKLGYLLLKQVGVEKLSMPARSLSDKQLAALSSLLKSFPFNVIGHNGFENAQATAGGAKTSFFDNETMMSKKTYGLYACGEVLDIVGECGGYNLQWAWTSGRIAGQAAARSLLEAL